MGFHQLVHHWSVHTWHFRKLVRDGSRPIDRDFAVHPAGLIGEPSQCRGAPRFRHTRLAALGDRRNTLSVPSGSFLRICGKSHPFNVLNPLNSSWKPMGAWPCFRGRAGIDNFHDFRNLPFFGAGKRTVFPTFHTAWPVIPMAYGQRTAPSSNRASVSRDRPQGGRRPYHGCQDLASGARRMRW